MHDLIRDNHPGPIDPENPDFLHWLDGGETGLLPQARRAASLHDYQLVLRDYANGFADGHIGVILKDKPDHVWPGFLVRADAPGDKLRVSVGAGDVDVRTGDTLVSCAGTPAQDLLTDHVLRPLLNAHVPQRLRLASASLMVTDADDIAGQWPDCVVSAAGGHRTIALHWRPITQPALAVAEIRSSGIDIPATGLRQIGDVWLISMPSFYPRDDAETSRLQTLVAQVKAQAAHLHAARHVVLDLRGNDGGEDSWGIEVAEALWGISAVDSVGNMLPSTVEWRVSTRNDAAIRGDAARLAQQGQTEDANYYTKLARRMDGALLAHERFMREPGNPPGPVPHLVSPFAHPVYLLTTPHCASACLDVVDIATRLPGVVQVGLETSSDTDYLETATSPLPSGHASLRYAMKVFRGRVRGANVSYKPAIVWPGGEMNGIAIADWIDRLP
jgi:hypothetical protein